MPYEPEKIGHVEVYYHALALYSASWTAYVVAMAILLATCVALSLLDTANSSPRIWGAVLSSLVAYGGAIYFISGISTYGQMLCEAVLAEYLERTHRFDHTHVIRVCRGLALVCLAANLYLVWELAGRPIWS